LFIVVFGFGPFQLLHLSFNFFANVSNLHFDVNPGTYILYSYEQAMRLKIIPFIKKHPNTKREFIQMYTLK